MIHDGWAIASSIKLIKLFSQSLSPDIVEKCQCRQHLVIKHAAQDSRVYSDDNVFIWNSPNARPTVVCGRTDSKTGFRVITACGQLGISGVFFSQSVLREEHLRHWNLKSAHGLSSQTHDVGAATVHYSPASHIP